MRGIPVAIAALMKSRLFVALTACSLLSVVAHAAVFIVPTDQALVAESDAIVIGTVREMHSEFAPNGNIVTMVSLELSSVLKGDVDRGEPLVIRKFGGIIGSQAMGVSENVEFWVGNRALVFLQRDADGHWATYGLSLGKFDFVRDRKGRELAVRWSTAEHDPLTFSQDGRPHEEQLRSAEPFVAWIRKQAAGPSTDVATAAADYLVSGDAEEPTDGPRIYDIGVEQTTYPPSAYSVTPPYRWDTFDKGGSVTFYASGSQPGYDWAGAAQRALAAWTDDPGSNVRYLYGGTRTAGFVADGINSIGFNNSTDVPAGSIAYAQWYGGAQHNYKGELFITIIEGDVVVKSGLAISQKVFEEAITHELGHTLGFRHSDQGTPSSTQAVMKASLTGAYGATLGPWDIDAVRTVYTGTTTTPGPTVPANLIATATSTTSITITWSAASNATGYQLERSTNINAGFTLIASPQSTSYVDSGRSPNTTYVYRVRAVGAGGTSGYSNLDHATTILFTDDPLARGVIVKAVHLAELRTAVSAVRVAAGLPPVSGFTDPPARGVIIKAVHIVELRNALTPALAALGKSASYTDPTLGRGFIVKAVHLQELRNYTK